MVLTCLYGPDIEGIPLEKVINYQTLHHNFLCGHLR